MFRYSFFILFPVLLAYNACSPNANFNGDSQFKTLVDGQSIEVVTEDEIQTIIHDDNATTNDLNNKFPEIVGNRDMGPQNSEDNLDRGLSGMRNHDKDSSKRNPNRNQRTCTERILKQAQEGKHSQMVISPTELAITPEILKLVRCGEAGQNIKVWVCHIPAGDFSKQKSQCLPIPALTGHIYNHIGKEKGHHADYLGKCKNEQSSNEENVLNDD